MTLMDAKEYDPIRERRRKARISTAILLILLVVFLAWMYRYWPEEHIVDHFFAALQQQQFEKAYGIWMHDADWKQHAQQYTQYSYNDFFRDWGPGGEWGAIKSYKIYASGTPKGGSSSGVIVEVVVNDRYEHARIWVEKKSKTLTFSPF